MDACKAKKQEYGDSHVTIRIQVRGKTEVMLAQKYSNQNCKRKKRAY